MTFQSVQVGELLVASFGNDYNKYREGIEHCGIDGNKLDSANEAEISELLKQVGVCDQEHVKQIQTELTKLKLSKMLGANKTHVFLSHNWGKGNENHERVIEFNEALKMRGLVTWMDAEKMQGSVMDAMANGIDNTHVVVAFITKAYRDKVNGADHGDNCKKEFLYACHSKPNATIAAVMEAEMGDPKTWCGVLGLNLSSLLYVDMVPGKVDRFEAQCDELFHRICEKLVNQLGKPAVDVLRETANKSAHMASAGSRAADEETRKKQEADNQEMYTLIGEIEKGHAKLKDTDDNAWQSSDGVAWTVFEELVKDTAKLARMNGAEALAKAEAARKVAKMCSSKMSMSIRAQQDSYEGDLDDQKRPHGLGISSYPNGDYYAGEWKDSNREGYGTLTDPSGTVFAGYWAKDVLVRGTVEATRYHYEGDFHGLYLHGYGKNVDSEHNVYMGEFFENIIEVRQKTVGRGTGV